MLREILLKLTQEEGEGLARSSQVPGEALSIKTDTHGCPLFPRFPQYR